MSAPKNKKQHRIPTIDEIVKAIDKPTEEWKGNCYAVACDIVKSGIVRGRPVYGYYYGVIALTSMFKDNGFWQRHGWIVLKDGTILDPTRWVFQDTEPYLWHGELTDDYDEGGNKWRADNITPCPKPNLDKPCPLTLNDGSKEIVYSLTNSNPDKLTIPQVFWLANLSYEALVPEVWNIYQSIAKVGMKAFVPIDNWRKAESEYNR